MSSIVITKKGSQKRIKYRASIRFSPKLFNEFLDGTVKNELTRTTLRKMPTDRKRYMMEEWLNVKKEEVRIFGKDPDKILDQVEVKGIGKVPKVLEHLKSELKRKKAFRKVGIFRNAGQETMMKSLKDKFDGGMYPKCNNANDSATLLKMWFRELPQRIFDFYPQEYFLKLRVGSARACWKCLEGLPETSQRIFNWLLELMVIVEEKKEKNKMTISNLAICFSPNLYEKRKGNSPVLMMKMTNIFSTLFSKILEIKIARKKGYDPFAEDDILYGDQQQQQQQQQQEEEEEEEEEGEEQKEEITVTTTTATINNGVILFDYSYEDVSVVEGQAIKVLSEDVNGYTYVEVEESGKQCYIPTDYFELLSKNQQQQEQEIIKEEEGGDEFDIFDEFVRPIPKKTLVEEPQLQQQEEEDTTPPIIEKNKQIQQQQQVVVEEHQPKDMTEMLQNLDDFLDSDDDDDDDDGGLDSVVMKDQSLLILEMQLEIQNKEKEELQQQQEEEEQQQWEGEEGYYDDNEEKVENVIQEEQQQQEEEEEIITNKEDNFEANILLDDDDLNIDELEEDELEDEELEDEEILGGLEDLDVDIDDFDMPMDENNNNNNPENNNTNEDLQEEEMEQPEQQQQEISDNNKEPINPTGSIKVVHQKRIEELKKKKKKLTGRTRVRKPSKPPMAPPTIAPHLLKAKIEAAKKKLLEMKQQE